MPRTKNVLSATFAAIEPMLLSERPPVPDGPEWLHEIKYDGFRVMAEWADGRAGLKSRNGANASSWFPEVVTSLAGLASGHCVVDGEMCVLDEYGRADFDRLMERARMRGFRPGAASVVYCIFDVLVVEGRDVMSAPLQERKALVGELFAGKPSHTLAVQHVEAEGEWLYRSAVALELEGIVSKRVDSTYQPGVRSRDWVKRKRPGATPAQRFDRGGNKDLPAL